jgi:hypothetical protein
MQQPSTFSKAATVVLVAAFIIAGTAIVCQAASEFQGVWKVSDTGQKPFEITLSADGSAKANRPGKAMTGTWKEESGTAVITWNTGWTTKITKEGNQYKKSAWEKGQPLDGPPTNSSNAQKAD